MKVFVKIIEKKPGVKVVVDGEETRATLLRFNVSLEPRVTESLMDNVVDHICEWLTNSQYMARIIRGILEEEIPKLYRRLPRILEDLGALSARVEGNTVEAYFAEEEAPKTVSELQSELQYAIEEDLSEKVSMKAIELLRKALRSLVRQ